MKLGCPFLLMLISLLPVSAFDPVSEALQVDKLYRSARNQRDTIALEKILTPDFKFIYRNGKIEDKATFLKSIGEGRLSTNVEQQDISTFAYGQTVIAIRKESWTPINGTKLEVIRSSVIVHEGSGWKLALVQSSLLPAN
ncbi:MAG: nuclear transport factor 2 family protein [Acidobacteria bacterium]|nr:nuclear transport factor 2 family protein [Acidobacteriota bacterium]